MSEARHDGRRKPKEKTRYNDAVQHLRRKGPATGNELPSDMNAGLRHSYVAKLDVGKGNAPKPRGRVKPVYYLYGDERRAVRKFIEVNYGFVESCMDDNVNPLNMRLDGVMWQLFVEEWTWGDEGDAYR